MPLYSVLSILLKSQKFMAILKSYALNKNGIAIYFVCLKISCYGNVRKVVCLHGLANMSLVGLTDPVINFHEQRTLHMKHNRMPTCGITA